MRTGLIAKKMGMTTIYDEGGAVTAVTLLKVEDCQVVQVLNHDVAGYSALQVGTGAVKLKNLTNPLKGHFAKNSVAPKRKLVEFRVDEQDVVGAGSNLTAGHFVVGQFVDVTGTSIGKGFSGWMKRWNFRGLKASHGVSIAHRSGGSSGQCQDPGKVAKGKKMPGQMGSKRVTAQNLKVMFVDQEKNLIGIKGAVPGHKDNYVLIKDAVKKALPKAAPRPTLVQG
ncbi:MAG: 50S ribosomal protein L3 [Rickettsiales bacterium]|jgi:large subunit ribosomal protein L3|nr:50S ribosomal protein L3 [Rickettsiales bacterium]